jgi:hypothetical protein
MEGFGEEGGSEVGEGLKRGESGRGRSGETAVRPGRRRRAQGRELFFAEGTRAPTTSSTSSLSVSITLGPDTYALFPRVPVTHASTPLLSLSSTRKHHKKWRCLVRPSPGACAAVARAAPENRDSDPVAAVVRHVERGCGRGAARGAPLINTRKLTTTTPTSLLLSKRRRANKQPMQTTGQRPRGSSISSSLGRSRSSQW